MRKPGYQAMLFLLLTAIVVIAIRPDDTNSTWMISGLIYGGFILSNAVIVAFVVKPWIYFLHSILSSALYLLLTALIVEALTNILQIEGSGESAMLFLIIIYHPVALVLVMFIKWAYHKVS